VLTFLAPLGGEYEPAHGGGSELAAVLVTPAKAGGGLLPKGIDDLVLERDEEPTVAGVPLARTTAGELAVDPQRLMPLGADDVESSEFGDAPRRA